MGRRRHLSRLLALQVLYAREYLGEPPREIFSRLQQAGTISPKNWTPFCNELTQKTIEQSNDLDEAIAAALEHWRIERLSKIDRAILRLALCEMKSFPDIPIRVTLNEYIELAKEYGAEESAAFVNGVLDRLGKQYAHKDFHQDEIPS